MDQYKFPKTKQEIIDNYNKQKIKWININLNNFKNEVFIKIFRKREELINNRFIVIDKYNTIIFGKELLDFCLNIKSYLEFNSQFGLKLFIDNENYLIIVVHFKKEAINYNIDNKEVELFPNKEETKNITELDMDTLLKRKKEAEMMDLYDGIISDIQVSIKCDVYNNYRLINRGYLLIPLRFGDNKRIDFEYINPIESVSQSDIINTINYVKNYIKNFTPYEIKFYKRQTEYYSILYFNDEKCNYNPELDDIIII